MSSKIKKKIDFWAEGDYFDAWSVIHFLAGVVFGYLPFIFPSVDLWNIFILVVSILIFWEVFEVAKGISETMVNRITDVLVAVVGFAITVFVYPLLPEDIAIFSGVIILIIYILLNFFGWIAYRKRINRQKGL